ncbi:MAG: iron-sulfur cluster assembly scaffold protein [Anaerolineae bacterium]|jgi:nitrogen fixation NifU-like protein
MDRQQRIDLILDHFEHPRRRGPLEPADVIRTSDNPACGDLVTVYVRAGDMGGPLALSYLGEGCTISQAAASMTMEMLHGLTLAQIDAASVDLLLAHLGPEIANARQQCATLAFNSVKHAVETLRGRAGRAAPAFQEVALREGFLEGLS